MNEHNEETLTVQTLSELALKATMAAMTPDRLLKQLMHYYPSRNFPELYLALHNYFAKNFTRIVSHDIFDEYHRQNSQIVKTVIKRLTDSKRFGFQQLTIAIQTDNVKAFNLLINEYCDKHGLDTVYNKSTLVGAAIYYCRADFVEKLILMGCSTQHNQIYDGMNLQMTLSNVLSRRTQEETQLSQMSLSTSYDRLDTPEQKLMYVLIKHRREDFFREPCSDLAQLEEVALKLCNIQQQEGTGAMINYMLNHLTHEQRAALKQMELKKSGHEAPPILPGPFSF